LSNLMTQEISNACHMLFGPNIRVSRDFISSLDSTGLKAAFKKRALETHPDRASLLNKDATKLNEHFKKVSEAYIQLNSFIETRPKSYSFKIPIQAKRGFQERATIHCHKRFSNHFYSGKMPQGPLLLGHFLYYSGRISWEVLIAAIIWQRQQRPMLGDLALKAKVLSLDKIDQIVSNRKIGERFGDCALRLCLLNSFQLKNLLKQQSRMQPLIGNYFIEKGILTSFDLFMASKRQQIHNLHAAFKNYR
jgi:hypothetical protein